MDKTIARQIAGDYRSAKARLGVQGDAVKRCLVELVIKDDMSVRGAAKLMGVSHVWAWEVVKPYKDIEKLVSEIPENDTAAEVINIH